MFLAFSQRDITVVNILNLINWHIWEYGKLYFVDGMLVSRLCGCDFQKGKGIFWGNCKKAVCMSLKLLAFVGGRGLASI